MKSLLRTIPFIAIVFVIVAMSIRDDGSKKEKILIEVLAGSLQSGHYAKQDINDEFSKKIFTQYLNHLDYNKRFLYLSDVNELKKYETKMDDQILAQSYQFFDLASNIVAQRIKSSENYIREILAKPFDFNVDETVEFDPKKMDWVKDSLELKDRWRKSLKYQTMTKLADLLQIQEDAIQRKDTAFKVRTFQAIEADARKRILDNYNDWIRRMNQLDRNDRLSDYYNSITAAYDPHSEFMLPKEKQVFDIAMSGKLEGIGAQLQENNGYIKVASIVPGSASWKQGDLKVGDVILKVGQAANEPVSIVDMRIDDAVQLIRGKKGTEVRLTVKKIDGSINIITIIRDEVVLEETFAKSAIVTDKKNSTKVGYIYLPKFYVNFENRDGRHCSSDVLKEIERLKKDNINGLILDLRENGGGSLQDVVDMVGLFVKSGPVVQVKSRDGSPYILSDNDSRIQYDGPLVVMVNSTSASASEILAAAIQDYNRGIIVGSVNTFGKGTVQRVYDFDELVSPMYNDVKPLGSIKMTIQKFYRITGGTTQLKGVLSDISLPDAYKYLKIGEKEEDNAMAWDEIKSVNFEKWKPNYDTKQILKQSEKRIKENADFKTIEENAKRLKQQSDETLFSLNITKYRELEKAKKEQVKSFLEIGKAETGLSFFNNSFDKSEMANDSLRIKKSNVWHADLKKDIYLNEAVNVMMDMKK